MEPDGFRLHDNAIFPHTAVYKAINSHLTYYACNFQFTPVTLDSVFFFQFSSKDSTDVNFFYNNFTAVIIFTTVKMDYASIRFHLQP